MVEKDLPSVSHQAMLLGCYQAIGRKIVRNKKGDRRRHRAIALMRLTVQESTYIRKSDTRVPVITSVEYLKHPSKISKNNR
jgi:hypothetical protein